MIGRRGPGERPGTGAVGTGAARVGVDVALAPALVPLARLAPALASVPAPVSPSRVGPSAQCAPGAAGVARPASPVPGDDAAGRSVEVAERSSAGGKAAVTGSVLGDVG